MKKNILIYNYNEPLPKQGGMERVTDTLAHERTILSTLRCLLNFV